METGGLYETQKDGVVEFGLLNYGIHHRTLNTIAQIKVAR